MKLPQDPQFPQPPQDGYLPRLVTRLTELFRCVHEATAKKYSGRYTPSLSNTTNVSASTAYECQYIRIDDVVHVSGKVDIDPTAAAATLLGISLPIASTFASVQQLSGVGFCGNVAGQGAMIYADTTNKRAALGFVASSTANQPMYFTFTYRVI